MPLAEQDRSPEAFAVNGRVFYAWRPNGVAGSPLLGAVTKAVGGSDTRG